MATIIHTTKKHLTTLMTIIVFSILALSLLSACSNDPLYQPDPNMPQELKEQHETLLEEQLAILEKDSNNGNARFEAAFRYHMLGNYSKAIEYYKWTLEYDANHIVALNNLADIYENTVEDYQIASEYIKRLYILTPDNKEAISDTVRILLKAENPTNANEALENYKKLTIDANNPDPAQEEFIESLKEQINDFLDARFGIKE